MKDKKFEIGDLLCYSSQDATSSGEPLRSVIYRVVSIDRRGYCWYYKVETYCHHNKSWHTKDGGRYHSGFWSGSPLERDLTKSRRLHLLSVTL